MRSIQLNSGSFQEPQNFNLDGLSTPSFNLNPEVPLDRFDESKTSLTDIIADGAPTLVAIDRWTRQNIGIPSNKISLSGRGLFFSHPTETNSFTVISEQVPSAYVEWLHSVGLSQPSGQVIPISGSCLPTGLLNMNSKIPEALVYIPFAPSELDEKAAQAIGAKFPLSYRLADLLDDKVTLYELLKKDTRIKHSPGSCCNRESLPETVRELLEEYPNDGVFVRGSRSISGSSAYLILNYSDFETKLEKNIENGKESNIDFLVQKALQIDDSPNHQYWLRPDGSFTEIGIGSQLLRSGGYIGSTKYQGALLEQQRQQAQPILENLHQSGYHGFVGIDTIESNNEIFFVECNLRVNGSTVVFAALHRLEAQGLQTESFAFQYIKQGPRTSGSQSNASWQELSQLLIPNESIRRQYLFDPSRTQSSFIIPVGPEFTSSGEGRVYSLIVGEDREEIDYIQNQLTS